MTRAEDQGRAGFTEFFESLGRTIAFHPDMARMLDSIKAALFLQQLMWWTSKARDPQGWVYKSVKEWEMTCGPRGLVGHLGKP